MGRTWGRRDVGVLGRGGRVNGLPYVPTSPRPHVPFPLPRAAACDYAPLRMKKVLVLLNEKSGTLASSATHDEPQRIKAGFESRGLRADVKSVDPAKLRETARAAKEGGYAAVVAGGGDGTLNTIAGALLGSE